MAQVSSVSEFDVMPSTSSEKNKNASALGKDEFLNLLVTQMRYQDPLEPSSDTEFISQMAQFSSLEQMQNLNNTFSTFQNYSMVGKYVTAKNGMENVEGYVQSITQAGDNTYALVDGVSVNVSDIFKVTDMAEELQVLTGILKQMVENNNVNNSSSTSSNDSDDDITVNPGDNSGNNPGDDSGDEPVVNPGDNSGDDSGTVPSTGDNTGDGE